MSSASIVRWSAQLLSRSLFLVMGFVVFLAAPTAAQASFGVSPSNIVHEQLRPGATFEKTITLSRSDVSEDLQIIVEPSLDEMRTWFSFPDGEKILFPKGQNRLQMPVVAIVPADAELKQYEGVIRVKALPLRPQPGGVSIVQGARIQVELVTTNIDIVQLAVRGLQMRDVTGGESLKLDMKVTNNGTTPAAPWVKLTVLNLLQENLEQLEARNLAAVAPNTTEELVAEFETGLGSGEYFALVEVMHDDQLLRKERLVFRIFDRAATEQGEQGQVALSLWAALQALIASSIGLGIIVIWLLVLVIVYVVLRPRLKALTARRQFLVVGSSIALSAALLVGILLLLANRQVQLSLDSAGLSETLTPEQTDQPEESAQVSGEDISEQPTSETALEASESGSVQGVFKAVNQELEDDVFEALVVRSQSGKTEYPVYMAADLASRIVYQAGEDEQFEVVEELSRWYRVVLPDGTSGWLPKSSVKSAD